MKTLATPRAWQRALAGVALLTLASTAAYAGPPHFGGGFGHGHFNVERMTEELGLTAEQRTAIEAIMTQSREQARPHAEKMRANRQAMKALTKAEVLDEAAIRAQVKANADDMAELAVIHARSRHAMRKILTPEQQQKLDLKHERHGRRHADKGEGGHGHHHGQEAAPQ